MILVVESGSNQALSLTYPHCKLRIRGRYKRDTNSVSAISHLHSTSLHDVQRHNLVTGHKDQSLTQINPLKIHSTATATLRHPTFSSSYPEFETAGYIHLCAENLWFDIFQRTSCSRPKLWHGAGNSIAFFGYMVT